MYLNILIFTLLKCAICEEVNIAGLFENNNIHKNAFQFAIDAVNQALSEEDFSIAPLVRDDIYENEPFQTLHNTCELLNVGVVGVFGPQSLPNIDIVQSVCDAKEIPHIITRWNKWPKRDGTEINFYPHPPLLSKAYFDIITVWEWKTFTVLYEDNESLARMMNLIQMGKDNGMVVEVQQLDPYHTRNYRTVIKELKKANQKFFVLDCHIDILSEILSQFQQVGLMNDDYHYFITNLDAHTENLNPFKYCDANITGIHIVNPHNTYVQKISNELGPEDNSGLMEAAAWNLRTETALIIDAIHMFTNALNNRRKQSSLPIVNNSNSLQCDVTSSWEHGFSVVNMLKTSTYEGLTGVIKFHPEGFRSDFGVSIFELREGGIIDIGSWHSAIGLNLTRTDKSETVPEEDSMRNKSFNVLITLTEPYGMLKMTTTQLFGNERFEGYGIDLIDKLAEMEGFNYTFIVREDKKNGAYDPDAKKWTGMIGDLLEFRADLAITDFTITSDREEAVDFTIPFMSLGISILFKKPKNAPPSFFSFADPFAKDTWAALAFAFFAVSCALYVMGRLCGDEWTNPYPCIEEPEFFTNQMSLDNAMWFATGSVLAQGSEIGPIALSTRMGASMWWFVCLIMNASYTANLAAFLSTENPVELFKDAHSLYYNEHGVRYGAKEGGATLNFFKTAEPGSLFHKIGQHLAENPSDLVKENEEGVLRAEKDDVEGENYAFFMESTSIEYATQRHCNLQQYGGLLDEKGYGIAMRKESPYRKRLSLAILTLQSSHVLDELKVKWWEERNGGGQCEGGGGDSEAVPLDLQNVEGCFLVTIYGTVIAVILVIIEHLVYVVKVCKRAKISFWTAFVMELRYYLDFNSAEKPVITKESCEASKSESMKEEEEGEVVEAVKRSKSKVKSKSKSRSPSISKSKSNHRGRSKSYSNKTRMSYGFVMAPSIENLKEKL